MIEMRIVKAIEMGIASVWATDQPSTRQEVFQMAAFLSKNPDGTYQDFESFVAEALLGD